MMMTVTTDGDEVKEGVTQQEKNVPIHYHSWEYLHPAHLGEVATILHGRMMRQIYAVTMIRTMFSFKCIQVSLFQRVELIVPRLL